MAHSHSKSKPQHSESKKTTESNSNNNNRYSLNPKKGQIQIPPLSYTNIRFITKDLNGKETEISGVSLPMNFFEDNNLEVPRQGVDENGIRKPFVRVIKNHNETWESALLRTLPKKAEAKESTPARTYDSAHSSLIASSSFTPAETTFGKASHLEIELPRPGVTRAPNQGS